MKLKNLLLPVVRPHIGYINNLTSEFVQHIDEITMRKLAKGGKSLVPPNLSYTKGARLIKLFYSNHSINTETTIHFAAKGIYRVIDYYSYFKLNTIKISMVGGFDLELIILIEGEVKTIVAFIKDGIIYWVNFYSFEGIINNIVSVCKIFNKKGIETIAETKGVSIKTYEDLGVFIDTKLNYDLCDILTKSFIVKKQNLKNKEVKEQLEEALIVFKEQAFKRFRVKCDDAGDWHKPLSNEHLEVLMEDTSLIVDLNTLPDLYAHDIEFYGVDMAITLWQWCYADGDRYMDCDKPLSFNTNKHYRRRTKNFLLYIY